MFSKVVLLAFLILVILLGGLIVFTGKIFRKPGQTTGEKIDLIVSDFDPEDPRSFERISEIVDLGEEAIPTLGNLLEHQDDHTRWASIIALGNIGYRNKTKKTEISSILEKAFDDQDNTLRMLAAAYAVSLGNKRGIPVLIESLKICEPTRYGEPPTLVCGEAVNTLRWYTNQDFGFKYESSPEERVKAIERWQDWWEKNRDQLEWDAENEEFQS